MPSIAIDSTCHARASSSEQIQNLLERSPVYTDDCDLYPQRMREVMNQRQSNIIVGQQRSNNTSSNINRPLTLSSAEDVDALLKLYPGAARYLQKNSRARVVLN